MHRSLSLDVILERFVVTSSLGSPSFFPSFPHFHYALYSWLNKSLQSTQLGSCELMSNRQAQARHEYHLTSYVILPPSNRGKVE